MSDLGTTGSPNPTARPDEGAGAEAVTLSSLQAENASTSGQWSSGAAGNAGMPRAEAFVEDGVAQDDDEGDDVVSIASSMGEPSAAGASILVTNGHGDHGFGSHDRFEEHTSGFHDDLTFSLGTALPGTGPEQAQAYEEGALSQQIQQIESAVASLALHSQRGGGSQESAAGVHHTPQPTPDELAAPAAEQAGPSAAQEAASKSPEPHAAPQTKAAFGSAFSSPVAEPSSTGPGSSSSEIVVERSTASDATAAPRGAGAASTSSSAADTDDTCEAWHKHHKHFFILSTSGKPIYSYHGDEASLAGLMALITALISVVADQGDAVRSIQCGSTLVVFMLRGPLVLVAASQLGETEAVLRRQLSLMYGQVVLVVTTSESTNCNWCASHDASSSRHMQAALWATSK